MQDPFFIGWQEEPKAFPKKSRQLAWVLFVLALIAGLSFAFFQKGFSGAVFEYGMQTELEGILTRTPVPILRIPVHEKPKAEKQILLVGFGKFGAQNVLASIEKKQGFSLHNRRVLIRGTLIYHDGKTLLELTDGMEAFLSIGEQVSVQANKTPHGDQQMVGEILDAKCYFGVMKPGYGKTHRSCAVRCISGGVPPVLKTSDTGQYFLLVGPSGKMVNEDILSYVGKPVSVCGRVEERDDWLVCFLNPQQDIKALDPLDPAGIPMCR